MQEVLQFDDMRQELTQEDANFGQKTLCLDVENILVRRVNVSDVEELNMLREAIRFEDYIIISKTQT
jgi:hypothetical protein